MTQALVIIDIQNDYFQSQAGSFPLHAAEATLEQVLSAVQRARASGVPCVLVQHVAQGGAPFFNANTPGADLHPDLTRALPDAPIVVKQFADAFHDTELQQLLKALGTTELLLCGMMTQTPARPSARSCI